MDVKCEFLNGPLDEEVYVAQPVNFVKQGQEEKVYKLHEAMYRIKQSPRAWNKKIDIFLREKEFVKYTTEYGVYVRRSMSDLLILCLYVYELLITGSCKKRSKTSKEISARSLKCMTWETFYTSLVSNSTRVIEA